MRNRTRCICDADLKQHQRNDCPKVGDIEDKQDSPRAKTKALSQCQVRRSFAVAHGNIFVARTASPSGRQSIPEIPSLFGNVQIAT